MKELYQEEKEVLFSEYGAETGLTSEKAAEILAEKGENVLEEKGKKSIWVIFLSQFADLLVLILIVAAVISMLSGNTESTIVIFVVIILNAILYC